MSTKSRSTVKAPAFQPKRPLVSADQADAVASGVRWPHEVSPSNVEPGLVATDRVPEIGARQSPTGPRPQQDARSAANSEIGARQSWQPGQLVHVPLERIRSNPMNPREIYPVGSIDMMSQSLRKHGQQTPALGFPDGEYVVLISGETRLRGARSAGLATLWVSLREKPTSDRELYELARVENVDRRNQTFLDDAVRWKQLLDKGTYGSNLELAAALELDPSVVSRVVGLADLPTKIMYAAAAYEDLLTLRTLNAIREFWKATDDVETIDLIHEAGKEGFGYRQIQARRESRQQTREGSRPRSIRHPVSYLGARGEIKSFGKKGRVEIAVQGLAPEQVDTLAEEVRVFLASKSKPSAVDAGPSEDLDP